MGVKTRQRIERLIVTAVINALLKAGFSITIENGGDTPELTQSTDRAEIISHLFLTDEEYIIPVQSGTRFGWVYAVYGNDGWDVISDYTVNLEPYIGEGTEVQKVIDEWAD